MEYQFIISGEIGVAFDWWTGQRGTTANQVKNFLDAHKDEDVHIAVCSPGGYVDAGLQIYQHIRNHGRVHCHIIGMTASAATFLTMGAKEVDMVDGSLMLIHNASTEVREWQMANKEQLDQLIAFFQKERKDLDTIDRVIASLYAKRNGKSVDDCMAKMTAAAWLSPQDALDFGLIDHIVEDEDIKKKSNRLRTTFNNSIFKDFGLPSLPADTTEDLSAVVDQEGNPAEGFMQKATAWMQKRFPKLFADESTNPMKKVFTCLCALLAVQDFEVTDGKVTLTEDQTGKIEGQLDQLEKDLKTAKDAEKAAKDAQADLQKKLDQALVDVQERDQQIANLKKAPGAEDKVPAGEHVDEGAGEITAQSMLNEIKDM
ncbi:MAG: ATP-dependent Clp protease proteolytic subunit [Prevotella sp.]|nr:ATP-dependent Clp protease proteolytic subunit [Prevotella sp.]